MVNAEVLTICLFLKFNFVKCNSQNKGNTLHYIYWKLLLNHENTQEKPETHGGKKKTV